MKCRPMNNLINIIVDTSGSMNEMGKIHLQQNLCRYAAQIKVLDESKYSGTGIRFYQWAENISNIELQSDGKFPCFSAADSSSLSILSDFISQTFNNTERTLLLILSDGNFPNKEILNFKRQLSAFGELNIRTVAVGADADLLKLKKLSTNDTVFLSENIASAIDSTIFSFDESLIAPVSTSQILQSGQIESMESEEDWDV